MTTFGRSVGKPPVSKGRCAPPEVLLVIMNKTFLGCFSIAFSISLYSKYAVITQNKDILL